MSDFPSYTFSLAFSFFSLMGGMKAINYLSMNILLVGHDSYKIMDLVEIGFRVIIFAKDYLYAL